MISFDNRFETVRLGWLPKGTKKTTPKEVAFIENWINNYPKKCLDYKSPSEFLLGG
ncbi:Transposase and inactivated derivatives, IS30 family [Streptococcus pneumoniae]|nr:Transposase and inactivated derivatives, IS30 family [Streptococcus pneumoniae]